MKHNDNKHLKMIIALQNIHIQSLNNQKYFSKLKLNSLYQDNNVFAFKNNLSEPQSIQIKNKQLYLKYVQDVLRKKQKELLQLQNVLNFQQKQIDDQKLSQKISGPIWHIEQAQIIQQKVISLKDLMKRYSQKYNGLASQREFDQFLKNISSAQLQIKQKYNEYMQKFQNIIQQVNSSKQQLILKLSKISQLQSYERYLTQFQNILDLKQNQITSRQKQLHQYAFIQHQNNQSISLSQTPYINEDTFTQQHNKSSNDHSVRKRVKIFQNKASQPFQKQNQIHNSSSKVMHENSSTNDNYINSKTFKQSRNQQNKKIQAHDRQIQTQKYKYLKQQNLQRITCQGKMLKFMKLWFKYSSKYTKGDINHRKLMIIYLWKAKSLYDENLSQKIKQNIMWFPKKLNNKTLFNQINYDNLSIKKRKYLQQFLQFQKYKLHRQKIITSLKNILRNKNRRQRTAVVLFFKKYIHNVDIFKTINLKPQSQTNKSTIISQNLPSSRVLSNKYIQKSPLQKSKTQKQVNKSINSKSKLTNRQNQIDMDKLKSYIRSHEQIEAKLATSCAQTQGLLKLIRSLQPAIFRKKMNIFSSLSKIVQDQRIKDLQKQINAKQFKYQLFMAKAKLALINTTNKVAHIQQLINIMPQN